MARIQFLFSISATAKGTSYIENASGNECYKIIQKEKKKYWW